MTRVPFYHISALLLDTPMTSWLCGLQSAYRPVKNSTVRLPERGRVSDITNGVYITTILRRNKVLNIQFKILSNIGNL